MKSLSPSAQAVLDAFLPSGSYIDDIDEINLPMALRAVAHYLQRSSPWPNDVEGIGIDWATSEIHDIAAELAAQ